MTWTGLNIAEVAAAGIGLGLCLRFAVSGLGWAIGILAELFRKVGP